MTADGVSRRNMSVVKMVKNTKALLIALEQVLWKYDPISCSLARQCEAIGVDSVLASILDSFP